MDSIRKRFRAFKGSGSLFLPKGKNVWIMRYVKEGKRISRSTKTKDRAEAIKVLESITGYKYRRFAEDSHGYLYVLIWQDKYYKIGRTSNPKGRIMGINAQLPVPSKVFLLIECANASIAENEIHKYLKPYRTNGEWFILDNNGVSLLKQSIDLLIQEEIAICFQNIGTYIGNFCC